MPLLKSHPSAQAMKEAVVLDLGDVARQAARLRAAAQDQASRILDDAEAQARKIVEQAKGVGHEQGLAEGRKQGHADGLEQGKTEAIERVRPQLEQLLAAWADVAQRWDAGAAELHRDARESALAFALRLGEKVTQRILEVDPTVVRDQIERALSLVFAPSNVSIRVHPDDRALAEQATPQLTAGFQDLRHVDLVDDPSVGRGGCVVAFGDGEIDAAIDTQMRRIVDAVLPAPTGAPDTPEPAPAVDPTTPPAEAQTAAPVDSSAPEAVQESEPTDPPTTPPDAVDPQGPDSPGDRGSATDPA
ncbi:MAG: FliH/SctL family protein [Planctomycetota bacterium]